MFRAPTPPGPRPQQESGGGRSSAAEAACGPPGQPGIRLCGGPLGSVLFRTRARSLLPQLLRARQWEVSFQQDTWDRAPEGPPGCPANRDRDPSELALLETGTLCPSQAVGVPTPSAPSLASRPHHPRPASLPGPSRPTPIACPAPLEGGVPSSPSVRPAWCRRRLL